MNDVLNETEVAAILDCAPETVQEKARAGELPAVKFGRSWRFPREALMQALNTMALSNRAPRRSSPMAIAVPVATNKSRRRTPPPLVSLPHA